MITAKIVSPEFLLAPAKQQPEWNGHDYRLAAGMAVEINGQTYLIPRGFVTDGASIPTFYRARLERFGDYIRAAVVHDWLYKHDCPLKLSRKDCDEGFRQLMITDGVGWYTRIRMHSAVRMFGWGSFHKVDMTVNTAGLGDSSGC